MGSIYVLTQGEYSDYHIVGVTTNEQIANALLKVHDGQDWAIEEFEDITDVSFVEEANSMIPYYSIALDSRGDLIGGEPVVHFIDASDINNLNLKGRYNEDSYGNKNNSEVFSIDVQTSEPEVAIKVARDARAKCLAEYYHL